MFLLVCALLFASALAIDDDICVELNHHTSNKNLEDQISAVYRHSIQNAGRPMPELDLPIIDPLRIRQLGPIKVKDVKGNPIGVLVTNAVSTGNALMSLLSMKVTGQGLVRNLEYTINYKHATVSGIVRNVHGGHGGERIDLDAKDVLLKGTAVIAPDKAIVSFTTVKVGSAVTKLASSLPRGSLLEILTTVLEETSADIDAHILDEILEYSCHDHVHVRVHRQNHDLIRVEDHDDLDDLWSTEWDR